MDKQHIWEPLLELAPEDIDAFMWMFEGELEDWTPVQAYKHRWTRQYIYLDHEGHAFDEVRPNRFEEVEPRLLLEEVMGVWS
ncbi:MAG TPA: hypothetical protein VGI17_06300 [Solirubrobacterales bacterium]|jgi:hypothetical protein